MVISQTGYSPSFKRPAEIMRMRRKRARSDAGVFSSPSGQSSADSPGQSGSSPACVRPFSPGPLFNTQNRAGGGIKRRNPFANIENTFTQITAEPLDQPPLSFKSYQICVFSMSRIDPNTLCTEYPADWSLKTRLLFTSPLTLSWAEQPKAQEEALGLSQHCRAQFSSLPHSVQSLVYWQHPSLPWLSMFPRINAERSFTGKSTPWAQDATLQQSLMREWSVSLSSLYSLLKSRLCPYFYLCSYQFTALFRAAGLGGSDNITALISPTTRGFREAMKAEGIEFSLPLVEERKKSRECCDLNEDADCQTHDDEDGSFSWLKEMGVQDKIKKPDGITIQLRKEGHAVSLDHKPESVVCVEGSHTFTLINFLINCKSVVAAAGSQAGLPPTLLAPVAFRGATMHTLKGRSVNVKSQVGSTYQNVSSLEITGPILPSCLHTITTLLRPAQKGNFSAALYSHTPTAVMNIQTNKQQVTGGSVDLSGCGLHPSSIQQLQQPSGLGKTALTHISMKNYSYTWKN
uniref:DNA replication fork stabilization factor DONSON n=1 Tax=Amphiprion percula TaxID=161767 RepID=A0A3P8SXE1_AMPPE